MSENIVKIEGATDKPVSVTVPEKNIPRPTRKPILQIYRTHPDVAIPTFQTKGSACFDLAFACDGKYTYKGYNAAGGQFERPFPNGQLTFSPGDRINVPTGLILDIPEGYSVRVHARSSTAFKRGLVLINSEGIIDSDYVDELGLLLWNTTTNNIVLNNRERLAQAELIKTLDYGLLETINKPGTKTDRVGGMGSTGVK
jgi:dUTP pyrophosphatase